MKKNHRCKPEQYEEISIERKTNFEIHSNAAGQKEYVVFTSAERKECHRFRYYKKDKFRCTDCFHLGKHITAKFYENENYVEADSNHICQPSEYFENVTNKLFFSLSLPH